MKGERHVGGEIRVLSNLIKRCMDDGMPPETTGMQGWIIGLKSWCLRPRLWRCTRA